MGLPGAKRIGSSRERAASFALAASAVAALLYGGAVQAAAAGRPARCRTNQLAVTLGQAGVAVGSVGQTVHLRNVSSAACTLEGYPALQLLGATGKPLPTELHRGASVTVSARPVRLVRLASGGRASFDIGYADSTGFGDERCPTSARVAITPPHDTKPLTVAWHLQPYGGDIPHLRCGELAVSPVYAG